MQPWSYNPPSPPIILPSCTEAGGTRSEARPLLLDTALKVLLAKLAVAVERAVAVVQAQAGTAAANELEGDSVVKSEVDSARIGAVASNEDVGALGLAADPGNCLIVSKSDIEKMLECNEEGSCLPVSPAESLPTLTVAAARPRKRPREATILEAYMLIEVFGVGGEECSRSVCLLSELIVCWSEWGCCWFEARDDGIYVSREAADGITNKPTCVCKEGIML